MSRTENVGSGTSGGGNVTGGSNTGSTSNLAVPAAVNAVDWDEVEGYYNTLIDNGTDPSTALQTVTTYVTNKVTESIEDSYFTDDLEGSVEGEEGDGEESTSAGATAAQNLGVKGNITDDAITGTTFRNWEDAEKYFNDMAATDGLASALRSFITKNVCQQVTVTAKAVLTNASDTLQTAANVMTQQANDIKRQANQPQVAAPANYNENNAQSGCNSFLNSPKITIFNCLMEMWQANKESQRAEAQVEITSLQAGWATAKESADATLESAETQAESQRLDATKARIQGVMSFAQAGIQAISLGADMVKDSENVKKAKTNKSQLEELKGLEEQKDTRSVQSAKLENNAAQLTKTADDLETQFNLQEQAKKSPPPAGSTTVTLGEEITQQEVDQARKAANEATAAQSKDMAELKELDLDTQIEKFKKEMVYPRTTGYNGPVTDREINEAEHEIVREVSATRTRHEAFARVGTDIAKAVENFAIAAVDLQQAQLTLDKAQQDALKTLLEQMQSLFFQQLSSAADAIKSLMNLLQSINQTEEKWANASNFTRG